MGARLQVMMPVVPVSMLNGILAIHLCGKEFSIDTGKIKTLKFEKQCRQFLNNYIWAYLVNEEYGLVLRCDGTASVFIKSNKVLVSTFSYVKPSVKRFFSSGGGAVLQQRVGVYACLEKYINEDDILLLSSAVLPMTFIGEKRDNMEYLMDKARHNVDGYPEMCVTGGQVCAIDTRGGIRYKLNGELLQSSSFCVL